METKQIITFSPEAKNKLMAGVDKVANAVKTTLGPKGKPVIFQKHEPVFSLDGVTVAKNIEQLEDPIENMGALLIKKVARNSDKDAGDGTTTATILTQAIFRDGLKAAASGLDMIRIKKGMGEALKIAVEKIKTTAKITNTKEEISNVATIASREREIGDMIAEIYDQAGKDAIITVEESKAIGLTKEMVAGLQINKGFVSPYFANRAETQDAVLENAFVLCTTQNIRFNSEIVPILELLSRTEHKTLLIIAEDISGEALVTCVRNKIMGILNICAIKAPGYSDNKKDQLVDIAIATGGELISEETGTRIEDATIEQLGKADQIIVNRDESVIIGGKGDAETVKTRIAQLDATIKDEDSDYHKSLLEKRVARLRGSVAIIKVGTITEEENIEKRYRIEDAVRSAKSAIEEGIVPGAGMMLWQCANEIESKMDIPDIGVRMGYKIVADAIREPAKQIIRNSGGNADVILAQIKESGQGYDSNLGIYVFLENSGIIDPAKVVRTALENAVSVAGLFLTTEAVISDIKIPEIK